MKKFVLVCICSVILVLFCSFVGSYISDWHNRILVTAPIYLGGIYLMKKIVKRG